MRKKAKRRLNKLNQELLNVRSSLNDGLKNAYKKGSIENCKKVSTDEDKIHYCTANFPDNPNDLQDCKTNSDFCDFCCHNEFGEMFVQLRENCLNELCKVPAKKGQLVNGRWIWEKKQEEQANPNSNGSTNSLSIGSNL